MLWIINSIFSNLKILISVLLLIFFGVISIWIDVLINDWFRLFYDALSQKMIKNLNDLFYQFLILALIQIILQSLCTFISDTSETEIRNKLALDLFNKAKIAQIKFDQNIKFSDQRISEDVEIFSGKFVFILISFFINFIKASVFILILFSMSPPINIFGLHINGILSISSILYFVIPTYVTYKVGIILTRMEDKKRRFEAFLRYSLIKSFKIKSDISNITTKSIKNIAFIQNISAKLHAIIYAVSTTFNIYSIILPLAILVPPYLSGDIQFGELIKATAAFNILQSCLTYLFNFYRDVIKCFSAARRISIFINQLKDI